MIKGYQLAGIVAVIMLSWLGANAQLINKAEYFFDTDPGVGHGTAITVSPAADSVDITGSISVNGLSAGFHKLFIRARYNNTAKQWSLYEGRNFYIYPPNTTPQVQIVKAEYFVDADPGVGNGTAIVTGAAADSIDINTTYNANGLPPGFHNLFVRVKNQSGVWSLYEGRNFYVIPPLITSQVQIVSAEYFFDSDPGIGNGTPITTGAAADSIDITSSISATGLAAGFHNLFIRVKNQSNVWSLYEGRNFYMANPNPLNSPQIVSAEYFFDTDPGQGNGIAVSPSFAASDSVDITSSASATGLAVGTHYLYVRVKDQLNNWSLAVGDTFTVGNVGIDEVAGNSNISILPNPSNGNFVLSYLLKSAKAQIEINDASGKLIYKDNVDGAEGSKHIDVSNQSSGIFFWHIVSDNQQTTTGKIAIVK